MTACILECLSAKNLPVYGKPLVEVDVRLSIDSFVILVVTKVYRPSFETLWKLL